MDASIPSQQAINKSVLKSHEAMRSKVMRNPMDKAFPMPQGARDMDDMMSAIPKGIK
jgi:hypothetical protein